MRNELLLQIHEIPTELQNTVVQSRYGRATSPPQWSPPMSDTPILRLPNELLLQIYDHLPQLSDRNAMPRSCRRFHNLLNRHLYKYALERRIMWSDYEWRDYDDDIYAWEWSLMRNKASFALFLDAGLDVNTGDFSDEYYNYYGYPRIDGETWLMWESRLGNTEMVRFLLDRGAAVNAIDGNGATALQYADNQFSVRMKILRTGGVDVGSPWVLKRAVERWLSGEVIGLLLEHGAASNDETLTLGLLEIGLLFGPELEKDWSRYAWNYSEMPW